MRPDVTNNLLVNTGGDRKYRLLDGKTQVLLMDEKWAMEYAGSSEEMVRAYSSATTIQEPAPVSLKSRLKSRLNNDYRTQSSIDAMHSIISVADDTHLVLSIGGGGTPGDRNPMLTNVNIGPFPNVDVVADAHRLPYSNDCVDGIICEAVIERLNDPRLAVNEMFRVLKHGAKAYICVPFLQSYHGYPHHYQNFTLTGLEYLVRECGFDILASGTCVGPIFMISRLISRCIRQCLPAWLAAPLHKLFNLSCLFILPLDRRINIKPDAYGLASTVFTLVKKT